jgi:signal transduction histidine kinase/CheY-like chemotaxis protein
LHDLVFPAERDRFEDWFEALVKNSYSAGEYDICTVTGSVRTLDLSAHVSSLNPGQSQVEFVGRDVTERKRIHAALEQARQAAEAANAAKTRFLANISHEIRTPLNAILGTADLLSATDLSSDQRTYVTTFQGSGTSLLLLLNSILDLTKVESGQLQLESIAFPIENVVTGVVTMLAGTAREKGIALNWTIDHDVPSYVVGDSHRIRQILTNLVGNAIKFTEQGEVRLDVYVSAETPIRTPDSKVTLTFVVKDTGIGIPSEKLGVIFERFTQADGSTTRKFGGSGLGLSISKGLAQALGGSISVLSTPGRGSEFALLLPLGIAPLKVGEPQFSPAGAHTTDPVEALRNRAAAILVAEDNEANRMILQAYLKDLPFSVDWAQNGRRAVEMEAKTDYDLILMDIEMPEMDGHEATRRIAERRKRAGLHSISILALTAHAFEETRSESALAGCSELLIKPVRRKVLLEALARHLQQPTRENVEVS